MGLRVTEDETARGGFAFLDLGRKTTGTPLRLSFRRLDVEPRHLGLENWQPEIAWIDPESVDNEGLTTVVRLGPVVIDKIEEFVPVEIYLQREGRLGQITWPFVTPSPQTLTGIKVQWDESPTVEAELLKTVEAAIKQPPPEKAPPPPVEPVVVPAAAERLTVDPDVKSGSRKWLWLLLLAVIVAGGGYLGWPQLQGLISEVRETREVPPVPAPPAPAPSPPPRPSGPTAAELLARYNALIRAGAPATAFVELGVAALAAGHGSVAFRAFEEAGADSSADAAWHLARFYDPRVEEPAYRSAAAANAIRAAEYYSLWKARSPRHAAELRSLCSANGPLTASDSRFAALCR